jgi:hypothetical protein
MEAFDDYLKTINIKMITDVSGVKTGNICSDNQISDIATYVFWKYHKFVSNISTYKISFERFFVDIEGVQYIFLKHINLSEY